MYIHNTPPTAGTIFFSTLNSHYVWNFLFTSVSDRLLSLECASVQRPGSGLPPLPELCLLISYLVSSEFLEGGELVSFIQQLLTQIQSQLTSIPLSNLICVFNLSKSLSLAAAMPTISNIYIKFITSVLFMLDVEETYQKLVVAKSDLDAFYSEDFEDQILDSLHSMTVKAPFLLPLVHSYPDPQLLDSFKVLNEITLGGIRGMITTEAVESEGNPAQEESDEFTSIFKCLAIASISDSPGICLCAIHTLALLLPYPNCRQVLDSTPTLEHIAGLLWDSNDLSTLQDFISWFPERIERLLITKTEAVDFDGALVKIKQLLERNAPFDRLICKVLDGLSSTSANVRSRSELFVLEYLPNIGIILSPLLRILRRELMVTTSVLSGDCRSISEQRSGEGRREVNDGIGDKTDAASRELTERPSTLLMDSAGRFNIPIITPCLPSEDEFDEMDEDNYLGLLDGPPQPESRGESLGDINHNDTKSVLEASTSSVTCLSVASLDPDKEFEAEMERNQSHKNQIQKSSPLRPPPLGQSHRLFSIHPYTTHMLIYTLAPDLPQMVYALGLVRRILETDTQGFLLAAITTEERESRLTYMELLLETVLRTLESFVMGREENLVSLHVEALRIIGIVLNGFIGNGYKDFLGKKLTT